MTKVLHPPPEPDLRVVVAELAARLAELEARVPPKRFALPAHWLTVQRAAAVCGYAEPTLYRWARRGQIVSAKVGGTVRVDPASLPKLR